MYILLNQKGETKKKAYYIVPKTSEQRDHHGTIFREHPDSKTIKMKYFSLMKEHIVHFPLIFAPFLEKGDFSTPNIFLWINKIDNK